MRSPMVGRIVVVVLVQKDIELPLLQPARKEMKASPFRRPRECDTKFIYSAAGGRGVVLVAWRWARRGVSRGVWR
eukprot:4980685-Prymnesium_polylepis.2